MAQINDNGRSRPVRVLRAADVIPPFNQGVAQASEPENGSEESTLEQSQSQPPKRERKVRRLQEARADAGDTSPAEASATALEVPAFDLAENILAEHRQMAARRRKAPGQVRAAPVARLERPTVMTHVVSPPSQDLCELQRVVAEIVARDIQRLCSQPSRPPRG